MARFCHKIVTKSSRFRLEIVVFGGIFAADLDIIHIKSNTINNFIN